jgi:DnaK suppressor protein
MSTKEINRFRELLVSHRGEITERIRGLQASLMAMNEPETEIEEEAQRIAATQALDRLGADGRVKMELIDLALRRISHGEYGVCEGCGDDISPKRLEAVPWARLCVECAKEYERKGRILPEPDESMEQSSLPEEYSGLSDQQMLRKIFDQLDRVFTIDKRHIRISVKEGIVHLGGSVETEAEHQLLVQLLTDEMGFVDFVDGLEAEESRWGEEGFLSDSIH